MDQAKNRCNIQVEKGEWNLPTTQDKIEALEAKLEKSHQDLKKKLKKGTGKNDPHSGPPRSWPAWAPGQPKKRAHKNSAFYWCDVSTGGKCGGAWVGHEPKECKGLKAKKKKEKGGKGKGNGKDKAHKKTQGGYKKKSRAEREKELKVLRANIARLEKANEDSDSSSGDDSE